MNQQAKDKMYMWVSVFIKAGFFSPPFVLRDDLYGCQRTRAEAPGANSGVEYGTHVTHAA
jgi:hypothetical protein